jgi:hypothetical protein
MTRVSFGRRERQDYSTMTEVRLDGEPVATITRWHYTGVFELCLPGRHHSTHGCFGDVKNQAIRVLA